jgi:ankyrin repeat protein
MNKKIIVSLIVVLSVSHVTLPARKKNEQHMESGYRNKNINTIIRNAPSSKEAIDRIKQSGESNLKTLQSEDAVKVLIAMAHKFKQPVADIAKEMKRAKLSYNEQVVDNYIAMGDKLNKAVLDNKSADVNKLLKDGADINFYGAVSGLPVASPRIATPLLIAVVNHPGDLKLAQMLLDAQADVNFQRDFDKKSILFLAVEKNNKATDYSGIVALLLKYNANVNAVDYQGETALDKAISDSNISDKIIQLLLENGNANQKTKNKALITAVNQDRVEAVRMLLENGAQAGTKNAEGRTARQLAEGKPEIQQLFQAKKK